MLSTLKLILLSTMGIIPYQGKHLTGNVVYDIILNETQKVSAAREAPEFLDSGCDEKDLYQVEKMSLENTKEKL